MWRKYKNFLRKRTDMQILVGEIIGILVITLSVILEANEIGGIISYIVMLLLGFFIMITFILEAGYREAKMHKEIERIAKERLREQLKEEIRKELEAENNSK